MEPSELKSIIEALIFVSEEPLTKSALLTVLGDDGVGEDEISACIEKIKEEMNYNVSCGLQLVEVAGGYQIRTKEGAAPWIQRLSAPKPVRLSQPALETLSIIAYRQPIVRSEIEEIRGVDVGAVLKTLLERNMIRIIGKRDEPGQPLIYGTTAEFLELFGLKSLGDLPPLTDIEELARRRVETQTPSNLSIIKVQDDEEPTEIVENEDEEEEEEEETEVIKREEDEDEEILKGIETGLKGLRRLEREIFPKEEKPAEEGAAPQEGISTDAPPEDDSTVH